MQSMTEGVERRSQMLKGVLDLCVLAVLERQPTYGYALVQALQDQGLPLMAEGSVYPLLARLTKNGFVTAYRQPSPDGPNRKYYKITDDGRAALEAGLSDWLELSGQITNLLRSDRVDTR